MSGINLIGINSTLFLGDIRGYTGVKVTWSSQAAVCWAVSAAKSWSHWKCVFPKHLKLWSHCAPRPHWLYQLKWKHHSIRLWFTEKTASKNQEYWQIREARVIIILELSHLCRICLSWILNCCILFSSLVNDFLQYNSQLHTFCLTDLFHSWNGKRSNTDSWFTSLSVVPVPIIQFILLLAADWTGPSCHGNHHQHHQQSGRSHDEQSRHPPLKKTTKQQKNKKTRKWKTIVHEN